MALYLYKAQSREMLRQACRGLIADLKTSTSDIHLVIPHVHDKEWLHHNRDVEAGIQCPVSTVRQYLQTRIDESVELMCENGVGVSHLNQRACDLLVRNALGDHVPKAYTYLISHILNRYGKDTCRDISDKVLVHHQYKETPLNEHIRTVLEYMENRGLSLISDNVSRIINRRGEVLIWITEADMGTYVPSVIQQLSLMQDIHLFIECDEENPNLDVSREATAFYSNIATNISSCEGFLESDSYKETEKVSLSLYKASESLNFGGDVIFGLAHGTQSLSVVIADSIEREVRAYQNTQKNKDGHLTLDENSSHEENSILKGGSRLDENSRLDKQPSIGDGFSETRACSKKDSVISVALTSSELAYRVSQELRVRGIAFHSEFPTSVVESSFGKLVYALTSHVSEPNQDIAYDLITLYAQGSSSKEAQQALRLLRELPHPPQDVINSIVSSVPGLGETVSEVATVLSEPFTQQGLERFEAALKSLLEQRGTGISDAAVYRVIMRSVTALFQEISSGTTDSVQDEEECLRLSARDLCEFLEGLAVMCSSDRASGPQVVLRSTEQASFCPADTVIIANLTTESYPSFKDDKVVESFLKEFGYRANEPFYLHRRAEFYHLIQNAKHRLYLIKQTTDERGDELQSSLFFSEVLDLYSQSGDQESEGALLKKAQEAGVLIEQYESDLQKVAPSLSPQVRAERNESTRAVN